MRRNASSHVLFTSVLLLPACTISSSDDGASGTGTDSTADDESTGDTGGELSPGLVFVAFRNLEGGQDGLLLVDLDPQSAQFGEILQRVDMGMGVLPHHLYFNHDKTRLYTTSLAGAGLYEVLLTDAAAPEISEIQAIDVGDNIVGEDMYFLDDGSKYFVTFMGGQGAPQDGSVGVFDGSTNELLETISAAPSMGMDDQPFILWPHGVSANEELGVLAVTSTVAPDNSGAGNTITTIDIATHTPLDTYLVSTGAMDFNVPVEVLMLRDGLEPFVLVTALGTGDVWIAPYDEQGFGEFSQAIVGADESLGTALEFYVRDGAGAAKELYISFGTPGVVNVYGLDNLPELPLLRTLEAGPGSHHVVFFESSDGTDVAAIQNNLLNLDGLNAGTITLRDAQSGDLLGEIDLPTSDGLMVESIESAFGTGYLLHH